jgi:hypothetical protein
MAIAASYLQTQGVQQGVWFDLDTMTPLMASLAFKAAATMFADLAALMPPAEDTATCMSHSQAFLAGRCAMTIHWSYFFKVAQGWLQLCKGPACIDGSYLLNAHLL